MYQTKLYIVNLLFVFLMSTGNKLIVTLRAKSVFAGTKYALIDTVKEIEI